jgi:hypothetical protein
MKEGQPYRVFARIARDQNVNIAKDLDLGTIRIDSAQVSCQVSMELQGQEPEAFEVSPPSGTPYLQFIDKTDFTEWQWRVIPKRSGTLHLLLKVMPYVYVEGVNEWMKKDFNEPPRVITVQADRMFELKNLIVKYWFIWSVLLTVILVPAGIAGWKWIKDAVKTAREKRKARGFASK